VCHQNVSHRFAFDAERVGRGRTFVDGVGGSIRLAGASSALVGGHLHPSAVLLPGFAAEAASVKEL
jgi:hypothetical protein